MALDDYVFQKQRPCQRKTPRRRTFTAGVMARDDHAEPLNCLIRDIGPGGAQIRVGTARPVPEPGYLINLKFRSAYHAHAVWRRGSLMGLSCDEEYLLDEPLPSHLNFLHRILVETLFRHARYLIANGMETETALRKFGLTQDS